MSTRQVTFLMQVVLGVLVGPALVSAQVMDAGSDAGSGSLLGLTLQEESSSPSAVGQTQASAKDMLSKEHEVHLGPKPSRLARCDQEHQSLTTGSIPSEAAYSRPAWS